MPSKIIVALDYADEMQLMSFVEQLSPDQCRLKIGKEVFTRYGPEIVKRLVDRNFDVFLDLKFHDIPHTVARACQSAADLGVWMLNVHSMGGSAMMDAARKALDGTDAPLLIAVTVLTSSGQKELDELGIQLPPIDLVKSLAVRANDCGLEGVVSSAQEAASIKAVTRDDFITVTPGIRPAGADTQDQNRVMTPQQAVANRADFLVIGRPITQSDDPCKVLRTINSEIH